MFAVDNVELIVAFISGLVGIAVGGFLFSLMFFDDEDGKVERRIKKYLRPLRAASGPSQTDTRDQLRRDFFSRMDRRWQGRPAFKALQRDIEGAAVHISTTEFAL